MDRSFTATGDRFAAPDAHRGRLLLKGLAAKMGHMVDDGGEVGWTVQFHLGQTLSVGVDHALDA